ncbi:MAG: hypothetical protein HIU92_06340 [Proteobacteria bacterium]|nr:hypothetical protein [Pseudomonadota bacterium]
MRNFLMAAVAAVSLGLTGSALAATVSPSQAQQIHAAADGGNSVVLPSQRPSYLAGNEVVLPSQRPVYLAGNEVVFPNQRPAYLA